MWSNIGKIQENRSNMELLPATPGGSVMDLDSAAADNEQNNKPPVNDALLLYADCHSTNKGLFSGEK